MSYSQATFFYTATIKVLDALVIGSIWWGCWYLRFASQWLPVTKGTPLLKSYAKVTWPLILVFTVVFHVIGVYRRDRVHFGFKALKKLVEATILATLVFIAICYFLYEVHYSRLYLAIFPFVVIAGLFVERAVAALTWSWVLTHIVTKIRYLAIGSGELLEMYIATLNMRQPYPFEWVGRLGEPELADNDGQLKTIPYLGVEGRLTDVLEEERVEAVVVSYPTQQFERYHDVLAKLSNELVTVKVLPDFGRYSTFTYQADQECGIPLLSFNQGTPGATDRAVKRLLDVAVSLGVLVILSPIFAIIALLVKLTSKGPVLYSQERVGADGTVFNVYKFRSMRVDAEANTGAVWASKDDDRTTALGGWLRRSSLDELPQFWNVLRGEMSLVGPRAERPVFVRQFKQEIPKYMLRHRMKSGITGWAQVNGWRGNTSLEERIKHDLYYIGHWSHVFDIKILLMTPFIVIRDFRHRHAY